MARPGRPKDWQAILRNQREDEGALLSDMAEQYGKIMYLMGQNGHVRDPGKLFQEMAVLGLQIGETEALHKASQDIIENKIKTLLDVEQNPIEYRTKGQ